MAELLSDENFLLFAAKHYVNVDCYDADEFLDDVRRLKYIKRLLLKYKNGSELNERLILNHIVILYNVFEGAATCMLFTKLDGFYELIKPFLVLLNRLPPKVTLFDGTVINTTSIVSDPNVSRILQQSIGGAR